MYESKQLGDLYECCGVYAMGLPYYKSHVIRSMHATGGVARWCIDHGLAEDHPATKRIFHAARQGEDEQTSAYTLAMSDTPTKGGVDDILRSTLLTFRELGGVNGRCVQSGDKFQESGTDFEDFQGEFGLRVQSDGSRTVKNQTNKVEDVEIIKAERDFQLYLIKAQTLLLKIFVEGGGVGEVPVLKSWQHPAPMDIAGTDGELVVSKGVKRQVSEAPEVSDEKPARRGKMEYKKGLKEQEKFDRRKQLIVDMNRLFLEWAQLFREENGSAEKGSSEARTLKTI